MPKPASNLRKLSIQLFIYVAIVFILLLASINIANFLKPKVVLGIQTQDSSEQKFWQDFLSKNPSYIPGLIETGQIDKAREIDPNYITL